MAETGPRAFITGHPVTHSRSPMIHGHWLQHYGLAGSYERAPATPEEFSAFIAALRDGSSGFVGGNVTIPHKEAAFALADQVDGTGRLIGAVNTLWRDGKSVRATNTDAYGFAANLDAASPGWDRGRTALVLGAGGASRAVLYSLIERGFAEIRLLNRTPERARELADRFGAAVRAVPFGELQASLSGADLFVNTTSLGMGDAPAPQLDFSVMANGAVVTDIVYVPLETPFLAMARAAGLKTVDGLGMLLHQAVPGFEIWFGRRPQVTAELRGLVERDVVGKS